MNLKICLIDGLYSEIWYIKTQCFVNKMTLIYHMYPRIMTEVNVSATVGMSATVGEIHMSATLPTVGKTFCNCGGMSATVGKLNMV